MPVGILQGAANTEETMKALRTSYDELLHRGGEVRTYIHNKISIRLM